MRITNCIDNFFTGVILCFLDFINFAMPNSVFKLLYQIPSWKARHFRHGAGCLTFRADFRQLWTVDNFLTREPRSMIYFMPLAGKPYGRVDIAKALPLQEGKTNGKAQP